MMKSSKNQKFSKSARFNLNHETLRILGTQELTEVIGGGSASGGTGTGTRPQDSWIAGCCPN
jgi:hypothetical protein